MEPRDYIISGGVEGRDRLRILARVVRPTTLALFDRLDIPRDGRCLDVGCGGGDVALDLARYKVPGGIVTGIDMDDTKLRLAETEAKKLGVTNAHFRTAFADESLGCAEFDVVYSRFLLSHLRNPAKSVKNMYDAVKPGGLVIAEDVNFSGHFCYPARDSFRRYCQLYAAVARARGGDPDIGPKLPSMLQSAGFERVGVNVVQPAGFSGDVKLMAAVTMQGIAEAVVSENLASREELYAIQKDLQQLAEDTGCVMSLPRVFQVWGCRPASPD